ncbi:Ig-like domain-containing protein [Nocardioides bruguierae]|uniref:Ig-like domain-containing protein n=1 Tax=Nocardioides bruguierae TaxID=2945102 RepID=UPI00202077BD|nr:Ig-like domain-containing protein [Nocardioides bruguierae]MCL8027483.1 Ig-like domain-containing protein [Nocardioides bruguierae]
MRPSRPLLRTLPLAGLVLALGLGVAPATASDLLDGSERPGPALAVVPGAPVPQAITAPVPLVTGTGKVGETLSVLDPVWDGLLDDTVLQWTRGGVPIPGATSLDHVVTSADVGEELVLTVRALLLGLEVGSVSTAPVVGLLGDAPEVTVAPALSGLARAGRRLAVDGPTWSEVTASSAYQWLRDGEPIDGATSAVYAVLPRDVGHDLSVAATSAWAGHATAVATSDAVTARQAPAKVSARLLSSRVTRATRARLRVGVVARGVPTHGGRVLVLDGGRTLAGTRLRATDAGRATLRLPRLAAGRHVLVVRYTGNTGVAASSVRVPVRVARR